MCDNCQWGLVNRSSEKKEGAHKGVGTEVFLEGVGLSWAMQMGRSNTFFLRYTQPLLMKGLLLWPQVWVSEMKTWVNTIVNGVFHWQRNAIKYKPKGSQKTTTKVCPSNLSIPEIGSFHFVLLERWFLPGGYIAAQGVFGNAWRCFWLESVLLASMGGDKGCY